MDQVAASSATVHVSRIGRVRPAVGAWALGFAPLVLLAFEGGGYDILVRSQAGIAVWWLLALGVLVGALRPALPGKRALGAVALLIALGAWSWISVSTSESSERTMAEVARIATYLGFFLLALFSLDRRRVGALMLGVASAIGLVALFAVLSRLQPHLLPANETGEFLPIAQSRLNWPVNYWNGLAALCAIGLPLMLAFAASNRSLLVRGLAAGAVPVLALCIDLTISRGGIAAAALALVALVALAPQRVRLLGTLAITGSASAILIAAAAQRDLVHKDLAGSSALTQGDEVTVVLAVVTAGAALLQVGVSLLKTLREPAAARFSPRQVGFAAGGLAAVAVSVAIVAGAPATIADAWDEFKDPAAQTAISENNDSSRLGSLSSNGRYELWSLALDSLRAEPTSGTGPGTYEFTWLHGTSMGGTVRDAHSLYLELGAELGYPGLILGIALALGLLSVGFSQVREVPEQRWLIAAAGAATVGFAFAAGVDWMWELPVVTVAALLLAAAGFAAGRRPPGEGEDPPRTPLPRCLAFAAATLVPLGVLVIVLAGAGSLAQSRDDFRAGALPAALERAIDAHVIDPGAATPLLQSALVREQAGEVAGAVKDAREATRREPGNWRVWLVLSRLEAANGNARASVAAFKRARTLNPSHPAFERKR